MIRTYTGLSVEEKETGRKPKNAPKNRSYQVFFLEHTEEFNILYFVLSCYFNHTCRITMRTVLAPSNENL